MVIPEGEPETDALREPNGVVQGVLVLLSVTVSEALRLRVGELLPLAHAEPKELREALRDKEGLPEALAASEGGTLPLGDVVGLTVKVTLEVVLSEGEPDADGQRDADDVAPVVRDPLRVTVEDTLRERVGVAEALGHGVKVPLTEDDGDAELQTLAVAVADATSLPVQL